MKKIILAAALSLGLSGCGKKGPLDPPPPRAQKDTQKEKPAQ